jgi:hypothetical protein
MPCGQFPTAIGVVASLNAGTLSTRTVLVSQSLTYTYRPSGDAATHVGVLLKLGSVMLGGAAIRSFVGMNVIVSSTTLGM